jgi:hypothetical protein
VGREISGMVTYDGLLSTTLLSSIRRREYWSGRVHTCIWEGKRCPYKCIDFTEDVEPMQREIEVRESLQTTTPNLEQVGVVPILAVAIDPTTQFVDGIVMPLYDKSLEMVGHEGGTVNIQCLQTLLETVIYLSDFGIIHGDICDRNVVLNSSFGDFSDDTSTSILVDFGEVAPSYRGESLKWTNVELLLINEAVGCLRDRNIKGAIASLIATIC